MKQRLIPMLALVAGAVVVAFPASTALAETAPPTLTGEQLFDPAPAITANCDVNGNSVIAFSASGVAAGPYPGTFTEVGMASVGPQSFDVNGTPTGPLLTFDAVFTIDSPVGQVTGTKTLVLPITDPSIQAAIGQCGTTPVGDAVELVNVNAHFTVHYDAEISSPAGEFSDHGVDPLVFLDRSTVVATGFIQFQQFFENFTSDLGAPQPLTTPGKATGGGQIPGDVAFGLTAKSDERGVKGNCTVIDRATNTMVKCLDATAYAQTGTHAVFRGNAIVNGTPTTYRITVDDGGEPGAGLDKFAISTASGYSAAGVLADGNIQVHP